jgi:SEC-C motif-containing protein
MINICPCQQQQANPAEYDQCCKPLHCGLHASHLTGISPEQLMRSRFSAYVLGLEGYLKRTWHSSTCPRPLAAKPDDQWLKLDVVSSSDSQVHFKAFFKDPNGFQCLEETSDFVIENDRLVYLCGDTQMHTITLKRNDVCLCGSGKKFKKCCDSFG